MNEDRKFLGLPLLSVKGVCGHFFRSEFYVLSKEFLPENAYYSAETMRERKESSSFLHLIFKIRGKSGYLQSFRFISISKLSGIKHRNRHNISRVNKDYNSVFKDIP